jgi:lipoprotein-anchoring transpeptidase ErfK/SrfK
LTALIRAIATVAIVVTATSEAVGSHPNNKGFGNESTSITSRMEVLNESQKSWIEIDLSDQHLTAWQGGRQQFTAVISTGKSTTPTYPGIYSIQRKLPLGRMRGADYDVPNVPYIMYFYRGYAIHGAYWHNRFGTTVSHGCINLPVGNARWLFEWAKIDTPVVIHE